MWELICLGGPAAYGKTVFFQLTRIKEHTFEEQFQISLYLEISSRTAFFSPHGCAFSRAGLICIFFFAKNKSKLVQCDSDSSKRSCNMGIRLKYVSL